MTYRASAGSRCSRCGKLTRRLVDEMCRECRDKWGLP